MVTLTSQCVSEDGLNLTCTVENVAHLFWFFNGNNTRHYEYFRRSLDEPCPCDPTFDSMLPGVQVTVQEATGADRFDAVSVLSANLPSLLALNIHSVECGSANTRSQSVIINSDIQCKYYRRMFVIVAASRALSKGQRSEKLTSIFACGL